MADWYFAKNRAVKITRVIKTMRIFISKFLFKGVVILFMVLSNMKPIPITNNNSPVLDLTIRRNINIIPIAILYRYFAIRGVPSLAIKKYKNGTPQARNIAYKPEF